MRTMWREFKAFAISGNVLDLALGFLIGAAFAKLVESLATNVLMQIVAAIFGQPDFAGLTAGPIKYGQFLTDLLNFLILAAVMFAVLKLIMRMGIVRARTFGDPDVQCPYCFQTVAPGALTCRSCGQRLVDELPSPEQARRLLAEQQQQTGRGLSLTQLPIPGRRRDQSGADQG